MNWTNIAEFVTGSLIVAIVIALATPRVKAVIEWTRGRKETLSQHLGRVSYGLPVVISAGGFFLAIISLKFFLISYDPIMWHDFLIALGYVLCLIALIILGLIFRTLFSLSFPPVEDLNPWMRMMAMAVVMIALGIALTERLKRERDNLVQAQEVSIQAPPPPVPSPPLPK